MRFRPVRPGDAARLARFDARVFGPDAWPLAVWQQAVEAPGQLYLLVESEPEPPQTAGEVIALGGVGFGPEAEILTIAVAEQARERGIGGELLSELIAAAWAEGAEAIFLEVRAKGEEAQRLYQRAGFTVVGRRKNYYSDDDALIMKLEPSASAERKQTNER
ncbi:ribosomal-protein-alanine N-acetyltransferase [Arcanobacterium wilhelmae]|uniref:Ribosomal-protein-alanine N-acetyltransferase n=1 Tax=Arcanobacterium wilhelmae TaxID=1803177 RepID=A0ABT9NCI1_9ACTO|nr:GNAT family N-acetyltransferase [Arcanobacterium wilhelmae]MDP9801425.1 ribosomal-protein-alanine N-acetyltransferase [Arcanobacterium wilhelmae]WFN90760.1 GNAT family N-acetyltransferase [Arcanobacterium wilhelmae]